MRDGKLLPVYIASYDMGSLIALRTILDQLPLFKGFIGIGPLVTDSTTLTPSQTIIAKLIAKIWPSFNHPLISTVDVKLITREERCWQKLNLDPLRYHGGTKAGMSLLFVQNKMSNEDISEITLPLLLLEGGNDQIVDPDNPRKLLHNSASQFKIYKEYPDAFHQLLIENDEVRKDVKERTTAWLNTIILEQ